MSLYIGCWFLPGDMLSCRLNEGIGEWGATLAKE